MTDKNEEGRILAPQTAVMFINWLLVQGGHISLASEHIYWVREIWKGRTYQEIANDYRYSVGTLKNYGSELCKRLKKDLGITVKKTSFVRTFEKIYYERKKEFDGFNNVRENNLFDCSNSFSINKSKKAIRIEDFKRANGLLESAGEVASREHMKLALAALKLYQKHNESEMIAVLLCKRKTSRWDIGDTLGKKAYRLGFASPMASLISWLIDETDVMTLLSAHDIVRLCNMGGDSIWMSSNNIEKAISLHKKYEKISCRDPQLDSFAAASLFNQALCCIDAGLLNKAKDCAETAYKLASAISNKQKRIAYQISASCLLAYIETHLDSHSAKDRLQEAYAILSGINSNYSKNLHTWAKHHLPIYLGNALQRYGMHSEASQMYVQSYRLAVPDQNLHVQAQVFKGKAQPLILSRENHKLEKSIPLLQEAEKMFHYIGAAGELAQTHVSLGCAFENLNQQIRSQEYFRKAELFYARNHTTDQVKKIIQLATPTLFQ